MNATYKFSFVILHYMTYEDTCVCVESIEKQCMNFDYHIIIVDNGSNNMSVEKLKKTYKNEPKIKIIENEKNLGFANGNNVGFRYAKKILKSDFIILANNDTLLVNNSFCNEVIKEYEKTKFAVLGPKIQLKDNTINPIAYPDIQINTLKRQLKRYEISILCDQNIFLYFTKYLYQKIKRKLNNIGKNKSAENKISEKYNVNLHHENLLLHGCFWIFSKQYIDLFDGLDNRTFLYREEELLYKRLLDNGLKNVYNPKVVIKHNEDLATNALKKTAREKSIFVNKNRIKSTKILIEEVKGEKND